MKEVEKILYKLGYFNSDSQKQEEVQGYIDEAVEYMQECGVPESKLSSRMAYVIKSLWADLRDKGEEDKLVKKDGMLVSLISNLRR